MEDAWVDQAIRETLSSLSADGLVVDAWRVLSRSNRVVLDLLPLGLVAKIAPVADCGRMARELSIAAYVAGCGGPAVKPAQGRGLRGSQTVVFSLWERVTLCGEADPAEACNAYVELRSSLDACAQNLPDFREAIFDAEQVAYSSRPLHLWSEDVKLVHSAITNGLSALARLRWRQRVLHGDPHAGNIAVTPAGLQWLDFEAACTGPVEWDLSALLACAPALCHDPVLFRELVRLRRACVVIWCAVRPHPMPHEVEAIEHHLGELKADA